MEREKCGSPDAGDQTPVECRGLSAGACPVRALACRRGPWRAHSSSHDEADERRNRRPPAALSSVENRAFWLTMWDRIMPHQPNRISWSRVLVTALLILYTLAHMCPRGDIC